MSTGSHLYLGTGHMRWRPFFYRRWIEGVLPRLKAKEERIALSVSGEGT